LTRANVTVLDLLGCHRIRPIQPSFTLMHNTSKSDCNEFRMFLLRNSLHLAVVFILLLSNHRRLVMPPCRRWISWNWSEKRFESHNRPFGLFCELPRIHDLIRCGVWDSAKNTCQTSQTQQPNYLVSTNRPQSSVILAWYQPF